MNPRPLFPLMALALLFGCREAPPLSNGSTGDPSGIAPVELVYGSPVPDFTLKDPQGASVALSGFHGKVVLIDFWATWCGPCLSAVPELKAIWQKYRKEEFVILSVSLDRDIPGWKSYIKDSGMDWAHVLDTRGADSPTYIYGIRAIPTVVLVDREGNFLDMAHAASQLEGEIEAQLR